MSAIVFGSINMDLVVRTPKLPLPGETLIGYDFTTIPGGKGANQAVALAKLAIATEMVGRVGGDRFGQELLDSLDKAGVGCSGIIVDNTTNSGIATIAVDDRAENQIIVIPGANGQVSIADVERLESILPSAKVLLLQLEIPLPVVVLAARAAKEAGVKVILDPAPAGADLPPELYSLVDILTPNRVEAGQLVGFSIESLNAAIEAARLLRQRGTEVVIIKLGKQGAICATARETFSIPAFSVEAVDTVGAGDAFNAGLAAGEAEGLPLRQSIIRAAATAALSVTKAGAQSSMPERNEVKEFLDRHGL